MMYRKISFIILIIITCTFLSSCSDVQPDIKKAQPTQSEVETTPNTNDLNHYENSSTINKNIPEKEQEIIRYESTEYLQEKDTTLYNNQNSQDSISSSTEEDSAKATDFYNYLIDNLDKDTYGGIYLEEETEFIWVIDETAVQAVIDNYSGTPSKVIKVDGKYSLKTLQEYQKELYTIPYEQTTFALFIISERENIIISSIPENDSLGLKSLVIQKMNESNIPIDCVRFEIIEEMNYGVLA